MKQQEDRLLQKLQDTSSNTIIEDTTEDTSSKENQSLDSLD
jgi:hypothetical protein